MTITYLATIISGMSAEHFILKGATAYHGAEMFNLAARFFNDRLVAGVESHGIDVFSPQRDGFEFSELAKTLAKYLPPESIEKALHTIILTYDVKALPEKDVMIARHDEPQDPGVNYETFVSNAFGVPVIAYRTDVRSPYGRLDDPYGGMHTFPVCSSQAMIFAINGGKTTDEEVKNLTERLVNEIQNILSGDYPRKRDTPFFLRPTFKAIHMLYDGIKDVHSPAGLEELVRRYKAHREELEKLGPRWIR